MFRAMFQADMAEKKNKAVDIQDLHPDVVGEMLQFIYTGNTPNLNRSVHILHQNISCNTDHIIHQVGGGPVGGG